MRTRLPLALLLVVAVLGCTSTPSPIGPVAPPTGGEAAAPTVVLPPFPASAAPWVEKNCFMGPPVGLQGTDVDLIAREGYALAHDAAVKVPLWVCEGIPAEQLVGPGDRDRSRFLPDPELAKGRRAELSDYEGSGYDRGHMAPAADHKRTQQLMDETHYLSNMAPQVGIGFNRHIWAQLEDFVRGIAERRGLAYVVTGPIFDPAAPAGTIGANQVRVPTHFYKIVAAKDDAGRWAAQAFVLENRKHESAEAADWSVFIRSIDWVEERTGLDFMPLLDVTEEERLEREASVLWN